MARRNAMQKLPMVSVQNPGPGTPAEATARAITKSVIEMPILPALMLPINLQRDIDEQQMKALEGAFAPECRLSGEAIAVMRRLEDGSSFQSKLASFSKSVIQDSITNDLVLRPQILNQMLVAPERSLIELNEVVYRDIFRTPLDDPWMGFDRAYSTIYTGLPHSGLMQSP